MQLQLQLQLPVNRFKGNTGAVRRGSANRKPEPKIVRFRGSLTWIKNRPFSKLLGMDQKSTVFEVAWHGSKIDRFRGSLAWIKNRPFSGFLGMDQKSTVFGVPWHGSHHIRSHHIKSDQIRSHHITSHHITSPHITLHHSMVPERNVKKWHEMGRELTKINIT